MSLAGDDGAPRWWPLLLLTEPRLVVPSVREHLHVCVHVCGVLTDSLKHLILLLSLVLRGHVAICHRYRQNHPLSSKSQDTLFLPEKVQVATGEEFQSPSDSPLQGIPDLGGCLMWRVSIQLSESDILTFKSQLQPLVGV